MKLSVVTTLYNSAPYLPEFYQRISDAARQISDDYELVFVNDGSPDTSLATVLELYRDDLHVRVVDLSRNFGHHRAILAGLEAADGDFVFLIDCDLEEPPEILPCFYQTLGGSTADVVYAVQEKRKGSLVEQLSGWAFYTTFNVLTDVPIPRNLSTARLMTRRYVDSLLRYHEHEVVLSGLWELTGYEQIAQPVTKHSKGRSSYTLNRKLELLITAITSFSSRPLILVFNLGWIIMSLSGLAALLLIVRKLFFGDYLAGWPSLIVSIWLMGGIIVFCLGVIGMYLARIFNETKQRPRAIVRAHYDHTLEREYDLPADPELRQRVLHR
jgi:putative glycosyltransferase